MKSVVYRLHFPPYSGSVADTTRHFEVKCRESHGITLKSAQNTASAPFVFFIVFKSVGIVFCSVAPKILRFEPCSKSHNSEDTASWAEAIIELSRQAGL